MIFVLPEPLSKASQMPATGFIRARKYIKCEMQCHKDLFILKVQKDRSQAVFFDHHIYQPHPGVVLTPADLPILLYMVTLVNGSPKIPS